MMQPKTDVPHHGYRFSRDKEMRKHIGRRANWNGCVMVQWRAQMHALLLHTQHVSCQYDCPRNLMLGLGSEFLICGTSSRRHHNLCPLLV